MQRRLLFIPLSFLLAFVSSCTKTDDTKPVFVITTPAPGASFLTTDSINFEALFTDNKALGQYRVEIKNNFGEATALAPWHFIYIDTLEGDAETILHYISIPDTIPAGWHFFIVKASDVEGNEAAADTLPVFIQNAADMMAPVIDVISPADSSTYSPVDSLVLSAIISDDLFLYKFSVDFSRADGNSVYSETRDSVDLVTNYSKVLDLDSLSGWFNLKITATDLLNNTGVAERKVLIQP